jgi:D-serine deaminase-like pyridoxal phosphate-dependent protein
MKEPRTIHEIPTPAAVIDLDRVNSNLGRMADYARRHGVNLRPHVKTHKTRELASAQIRSGTVGLTCATLREAEVMASVTRDVFVAYPPVGDARLERLLALAPQSDVRVALDSGHALDPLSHVARAAGVTVGVLVEIDVGMHRVGLSSPADVVALAKRSQQSEGTRFDGVAFYPGHIRQHVSRQTEAIADLSRNLRVHLDALRAAGLEPGVVSGGSTPAAFSSHCVEGQTEMRPGTYVFNDRTTAAIGACDWNDCAYSVLATVVSTAVPDQIVVDSGSKALNRENLRGTDGGGFGALLDDPEIVVKAMSEEHGLLDCTGRDVRPRVGDRVRIVPNHVCISVNLHAHLWVVQGDVIVDRYEVVARGWD